MKLASVILDIPTQALDAPYTYLLPEEGAPVSGKAPALSRPGEPAMLFPDADWGNVAEEGSEAEGAFGEREAAEGHDAAEEGVASEGRETASAAFPIEVGCAVLVPFGRRQAVGFVVELIDVALGEALPGNVDPAKLKRIVRAVSRPYFNEVGARCARFLADRYIAPFSSCIRLFMPPGGVPRMERIDGRWQLTQPLVSRVDERWVRLTPAAADFTPRKGAVKQEQILAALAQGDLRVSELRAEYGSVSQPLKALEAKGVVAIESRRRVRGADAGSAAFEARVRPRPELTADQRRAVDAIGQAADAGGGQVVLVDGVTGSGKTEVYLCAIERVLAAGKGAIVLVPEISLTPQTLARFRGRFGDTVAVLHSRMSQGERYDQWDLIRTGAARVVVGARSALFAPMDEVGIIIIDEEHESSYKQDQAPRYVTRDVAEWLARDAGAVLVLGSATPSIEALHRCETDPRWRRVSLPTRANGKPLPAIQVVDMAREFGGGNRSMFSRALQQALFDTVDKGEKAVLMLNQRGFAQFLLCRDCGFVPSCESCSTSLTYHERAAKLICHHCGAEHPVPAVCPECGSPYLKRFGAGTQRVESELVALLADRACDVVRMDADTTARKGAHQRLLERFAGPGASVLLGTQMIAKGLDFDEVTLVGVINADTMLKLPDFRSSERTFDLIEQVAGRSGRADLPGRVIVQTYSARDVAISSAAHYDRDRFLASELELRRGLGYPPFVRLANVLVWGKDEGRVAAVAQQVFGDLSALVPRDESGWLVLPPTPCVLERLKGAWRRHVVVKAPADADLSVRFAEYFRTRKPDTHVRVSIDIDPVNLL